MLEPRNAFIKRRPISDKVGSFIWPYIDMNVITNSIETAEKMGLKYMELPFYIPVGGADQPWNMDWVKARVKDVANLCKEHGIIPMVNFHSTNTYLGEDPITHSMFTPQQLQFIKDNISDFMQMMAHQGIIWSGWNEPNWDFWCYGHAGNQEVIDSYIDFEKWIIKESKRYDPQAINATLNFADSPGFDLPQIETAQKRGLLNEANGMIFHPYLQSGRDQGLPETLFQIGTVPKELNQNDLPLMTTEYGFPRLGSDNWQGHWSMEDAAKLTVRETLILDCLGYSVIGNYSLVGSDYQILNDDGTSFNLVGGSLKTLVDELDGYSFVESLKTPDKNSYVFLYQKDGNQPKIAYWATQNIGQREVELGNAKIKLNFKDEVHIIEPDLTPNQKEYFPNIKEDTSLGTRVI